MIKYILKCSNKHEFESWFSNSKEFEKLKNKKLLECIFCNSQKIEKSIMSPSISLKEKGSKKIKENSAKEIRKNLLKIKKFVEKNFEYVGDKFTQEMRSIYYGNKKKKRNIYGTTTEKERKDLREEGIELTTIPWIENKEN
tara:strand:- start:817 stop:1239 length:423 start_codon:yes stop_codon:yes gene_type:complete